MTQPDPIDAIVDCLVQIAVDEHLRLEAARLAGSGPECPNPVPLPDLAKAA